MNLLEYEAKSILRRHRVRVPDGVLVRNVGEVEEAYQRLGSPVVIKPQTFLKRRGKAGLIRFAHTLEEAKVHVEELLGSEFMGKRIREVLLEEFIDGEAELYMAIIIDRSRGRPVAILSSKGGVDIESIAKEYPEEIASAEINVLQGLQEFQARDLTMKVGLGDHDLSDVVSTFLKLYEVFLKYDAEIVEINPLKITGDWNVVALDAVININDDSVFRHPELGVYRIRETSGLEDRARQLGLSFVELEGKIGIIGNGAGLTMATADMVHLYGGRPAYFLDVGGGISSEGMKRALDIVMGVKTEVILINIFAGISRCDEVALGIMEAKKQGTINQPIVVRMIGTSDGEGIKILESIGIKAFTSMEEAVRMAVALAEEG